MPVSTCPLCGTTPHECRFMEPTAPAPVPAAEEAAAIPLSKVLAHHRDYVKSTSVIDYAALIARAEHLEALAARALRGTVTEEMVERHARWMCEYNGEPPDEPSAMLENGEPVLVWQNYAGDSRAALQAALGGKE